MWRGFYHNNHDKKILIHFKVRPIKDFTRWPETLVQLRYLAKDGNKEGGGEGEINWAHVSQGDVPVCSKGFSFHDRALLRKTIPIKCLRCLSLRTLDNQSSQRSRMRGPAPWRRCGNVAESPTHSRLASMFARKRILIQKINIWALGAYSLYHVITKKKNIKWWEQFRVLYQKTPTALFFTCDWSNNKTYL